MKITKKIMSVVLAAVMVIGALAVSVSADSIYDTAENLPSGESQSFTLPSSGWYYDYKITLSKKGTLTLNINASMRAANLYLYDADGNTIVCSEYNFTSGDSYVYSDRLHCKWNSTTENFKCTVKYELTKGTYYIRFKNDWTGGTGKTTFKATYPSKDSEEEISGSTGKISYLTLEMEVGDTIRLGTITEPADADVKWSSSKSSIATVSASGKVTAKKEGSAIITAKSGSSVKKIKIIVV